MILGEKGAGLVVSIFSQGLGAFQRVFSAKTHAVDAWWMRFRVHLGRISACLSLVGPEQSGVKFMDTQDVSTEIMFKLWPWVEANRNRLVGGVAVAAAVGLIYSYVIWERGQNEIASGEAFTQLTLSVAGGMDPTQASDDFMALASKYPGTAAADRSVLQAASILFESGHYSDAGARFDDFSNHHSGPLQALAILGLGASLQAEGKLDQAAEAYMRLSSNHTNPQAYLEAQYSLGQIAEQNGKLNDAMNYYMNAAQAGEAGGSVAQEAQSRAFLLKQKLAALESKSSSTNNFINLK